MPQEVSYRSASLPELDRLQRDRLAWLESRNGAIVALPSEYPDGYQVKDHHHSRDQLLHALTGVVLIKTQFGRWMVPPDHAMWIPAGVKHEIGRAHV